MLEVSLLSCKELFYLNTTREKHCWGCFCKKSLASPLGRHRSALHLLRLPHHCFREEQRAWIAHNAVVYSSTVTREHELSMRVPHVLHLVNSSTKWVVFLTAAVALLWRHDSATMWCLSGAVTSTFLCVVRCSTACACKH